MEGVQFFWIIDRVRMMHICSGLDKAGVIDLFNDYHTAKADVVMPAVKCNCGKWRTPLLPDWMPALMAHANNVCDHHDTPAAFINNATPETLSHYKNALI